MGKNGVIFSFGQSGVVMGVSDWSFAGLKKPVLWVEQDNARVKVASFNDWIAAEVFIDNLETALKPATITRRYYDAE